MVWEVIYGSLSGYQFPSTAVYKPFAHSLFHCLSKFWGTIQKPHYVLLCFLCHFSLWEDLVRYCSYGVHRHSVSLVADFIFYRLCPFHSLSSRFHYIWGGVVVKSDVITQLKSGLASITLPKCIAESFQWLCQLSQALSVSQSFSFSGVVSSPTWGLEQRIPSITLPDDLLITWEITSMKKCAASRSLSLWLGFQTNVLRFISCHSAYYVWHDTGVYWFPPTVFLSVTN